MPKQTDDRVRLHLALKQEVIDRINRVMKAIEAESVSETIRRVFHDYEEMNLKIYTKKKTNGKAESSQHP